MSSMRNAVQRRNHKERAQPLERQKWGLLEKHKDYSLRAKDHNEKKRRLKLLRQKVADRNPDEFAFGMMSASTNKGARVTQRGKENGQGGPLSHDVVKLLKTQDTGYLQTVLQQTRKERERIEKHVILSTAGSDASNLNKKISFDADGLEIEQMAAENGAAFDGAIDALSDLDDLDGLDDLDDLIDGPNKSDDDREDTKGLSKEEFKLRQKKKRQQEVLRNHLRILKDRESQLSTALDKAHDQRARMNNTVGGVNKSGVKFKVRERKR